MRRRNVFVSIALLATGMAVGVVLRGATTVVAEPGALGPPDFVSVVERSLPGVVHVHNYLARVRDVPEPGEHSAGDDNVGSGFVWSADGYIITNRHVTEGAKQILVEIDGRGWFPAVERGNDPMADVALLKIDAGGLVPLPIGNPRLARRGQWVLAGGSPYRLPRSFSVGIISGLERSDVVNPNGYEDYIQTDAAINIGSSGGPLMDANGRVIGLNTAILSRSGGNQGIAFAVPIDVVIEAATQLRARGTVIRPTLGVVVRAASPLESLGLPGGGGLYVTRFATDSPARKAGLVEGDIILSVDGLPTPSRGPLLRTIWGKKAGTVVALEFLRAKQRLIANAQLIER